MKRRFCVMGAGALLLAQVFAFPAQAAKLPVVLPFPVSEDKISFIDGEKRVTQAVYDFVTAYVGDYIGVRSGGKLGIVDALTGEEVTPCIWEWIDLRDGKETAIVRNDREEYILHLPTRQLSKRNDEGKVTYIPSEEEPQVVLVEKDQTSKLLDLAGKELIPPFEGKIYNLSLRSADDSDDKKAERYLLAESESGITLYQVNPFKKLFSLENAKLDGSYQAYIRVKLGDKYGLIDKSGKFVLEPVYKKIGLGKFDFLRLEGDQGQGLWKDGKILAEPRYKEVNVKSPSVYSVRTKKTETYYALDSEKEFTLRKGAKYLENGYVLGQDAETGKYGVIKAGGKTHGQVVIPFAYENVEKFGANDFRLLVRSDGKKGLIPVERDRPVKEPQVWFDTITLLDKYMDEMFKIQDGGKVGLYSPNEGLLLAPAANREIHYDAESRLVVVLEPDGKKLTFDPDEMREEKWREKVTEYLDRVFSPKKHGYVLVDRKTGKELNADGYGMLYQDQESGLLIGSDEGAGFGDLYTLDGKLLTPDVKLAVERWGMQSSVGMLAKMNETIYMAGTKQGVDGWALFKLEGQEFVPVTDFVYQMEKYEELAERFEDGSKVVALIRKDGKTDLWADRGEQGPHKLEGVNQYRAVSSLNILLVKDQSGWDVYSSSLERLTHKNYHFLDIRFEPSQLGGREVVIYQDGKTGLYGVLGADLQPATKPLYTSIERFDLHYPNAQYPSINGRYPAFYFTAGQEIGYLDAQGNELFRMKHPNHTAK